MLKYKNFMVLALIIILATNIAGCGSQAASSVSGTTQSPPGTTSSAVTTAPQGTTPTLDAILKLVNTASVGMNTFESKSQMTMNMSLMGITVKADMTANMTVDVPGKKFFMGVATQTSGVGQASTTDNQMYLITDTLYTKTNGDSKLDPNTWYREVLAAADLTNMWKTQDVGAQIQTLLDSATLQIVGTETINGIQCYKLKVNPNMDKFMAYLAASGNDMSAMGITNASQAFKQLDVNIWVNKANYLPAKLDVVMVFTAQGMDINVTMSSTFDKVNQPVTISLPAAAQAALPMPA